MSSTLKLWTILCAFLFPGVDDPTPPEDPADPPPNDPDPGSADPDPELSDPDPAPAPAAPASSSTDELLALRENNAALRAALATVAPAASRQAPVQSDDERILQDPNATPEQKWQAQANLALRAGFSNSQQALQLARDSADAASFQLKCVNDPIARKYAKDVETKRQEFIGRGQIPPERDNILTWVIGEKVRARASAAPAAKPGAGTRPATPATPRGSTPNARSDVGRGGKTDAQKRRDRLENVQI